MVNTPNSTGDTRFGYDQRTTLLLVATLSREVPHRLLRRAAIVAQRLGLDVVVYSPAVSTAPAHPDVDRTPVTPGLELAEQRASEVAAALVALGISARGHADSTASALQGTVECAARSNPSVIMLAARDYADWVNLSLSSSAPLECLGVPIWIENNGAHDGVVLAALEIEPDSDSVRSLDERIGQEARDIAERLDTEVHVVHTIAKPTKLQQVVELALPKDVVDSALQRDDDDRVVRAHSVAEHHGIPKEHVHIRDGDLTDILAELEASMPVGVIVIGASHRIHMLDMVSQSRQQRVLDQLRADLLILDRPK